MTTSGRRLKQGEIIKQTWICAQCGHTQEFSVDLTYGPNDSGGRILAQAYSFGWHFSYGKPLCRDHA